MLNHLLFGFVALFLPAGAAPEPSGGARPVGAAGGLQTVVLDPGHGGTNLGALARVSGLGYEKQHTLRIARLIAAHLRAEGVTVFLTRESDVDMTLANRVKYANSHRADVFVSIHLNSTERPGPVGHETFFLALESSDEAARRLTDFENAEGQGQVLAEARPGESEVAGILLDLTQNQAHEDAQSLAACIQKRLGQQSPFPNRGVLQAPFVVLMGAAMPAVVVESGFLNHPREGLFVTSEEGQARIARGIAEGILDFGRLVVAARQPRASGPEGAEAPPLPEVLFHR